MTSRDTTLETPGARFSLRAFFWMGGAALLVALALVIRNPVPLFAGLVLLLAPVAAGLGSPRPPVRARLTWEAREGTADVDIVGRLDLPDAVSPRAVRFVLHPPPPFRERERLRLTPDSTGLEFHASWRSALPCLAVVPVPVASWRDALDLVEVPLTLQGEPLTVERYPPEVTQFSRARLKRTTQVPGEVRSRAIGEAGEFFAVRPARPGDPGRLINWSATARTGRRMANEFLLERTGDLLILVDARPSVLGPERDQTLVALECVAALGIASAFLREKSRVGLGVFDEFLRTVPLGSGKVQRTRIGRLLRETRLGKAAGPSERFAISVRRYFPSGLSTLLLSPLAEEGSEDVLTHLRRRGYAPFVLSPSPLALARTVPDDASSRDPLAERLGRVLRRERLSEVWREAPVIDWDNYWSLAPLVEYLRAPVRNRRSA